MGALVVYCKLLALRVLSLTRSFVAGSYCRGFLVHGNDLLLLTAKQDVGVGRRLAFGGRYDHDNLVAYKKMLSRESRVLVVGTHVGAVMLSLAKICREVVGIEANPESFDLLRKNILINGLENCKIHNVAAYDRDDSLDFVVSRVTSGGAKVMPVRRRFEFFYDAPEVIRVPCCRLDDLLADEDDFDFVLMDIEGAEYRALAGMQRILDSARYFVCEIVPNHFENAEECTFDEFVARIPPVFQQFALVNSSAAAVGRSGLGVLYAEVERSYPFGGG